MTDTTLIAQLTAFFAARGLDAYVVGGAVRDRLLGRETDTDIDLAVDGDAVELGKQLAKDLGGSPAPLSVPRGMMRVVLPGSAGGGAETDTDADFGDGSRTIDLTGFAGDIEGDLARRDFTINAMGVPLPEWQRDDFGSSVVDPFGGRGDLTRKSIRALSSDVFEDDPGRLLRAVRLSGELGMRIDPDTVGMIAADSRLLRRVSPPRIRDEFLRTLAPNGARGRIEALDMLGLLGHIIPELMVTKGVDQPKMHYWDVWGHTLHTVGAVEGVTGGHQNSPVYSCVPWIPESEAHFAQRVSDGHTRRTILKLAALFHDVAKPQTKSIDATGRTRFFGHSEQGAEIAANRLSQLRVGYRGVNMVSQMVEHHLRPTNMMQEDGKWPTNRAIHRYFREVEDVAVDTLYLCLADYLGAKGPELSHTEWLDHARMIGYILHLGTQTAVSPKSSRLINGHELMAHFQLQPGPHVGSLLEQIEEARAAGEIETQEQALNLAAAMLGKPEQARREQENSR
jgi:poly(A) polymerase